MNFTGAQPAIPVLGGGSFPARRIDCVGRNYRSYALEMGVDPDREEPSYSLKPGGH